MFVRNICIIIINDSNMHVLTSVPNVLFLNFANNCILKIWGGGTLVQSILKKKYSICFIVRFSSYSRLRNT